VLCVLGLFYLFLNVLIVTCNWSRCSHREDIKINHSFTTYTAHNERAIMNDNARSKWQEATIAYVV
jgi:hypothetical protein